MVNLSKLSYNALNKLSNSLEPESANICLISANLTLFDKAWIICSFKSSFNDDSSSFTTWLTTEPCIVLIIFLYLI